MNHLEYKLTPVDFDPFASGEIEKIIPTIESQREVWLSCVIGGVEANLAYNESISLNFRGSLQAVELKESLETLLLRHESLRASFSTDGTQMFILANAPLKYAYFDLSTIPDHERIARIEDYHEEDIATPFDLTEASLVKFGLFKKNESSYLLTIKAHHIICDGWSIEVLLKDLSNIYNSKCNKTTLPQAPLLFSDYALRVQEFSKTNEHERIENYWVNKYKNNTPFFEVPCDLPRPALRTYQAQRDDFRVETSIIDALKKTGAKYGCSLVNTLMTAFEVLLYKYTGHENLVIGLPTAGQSATGMHNLVGHCVNLLPLNSTPDSEFLFADYLKLRKTQTLDDYECQQYSFGSLLKKINYKRDASRVPLVPVHFNIDTGMGDSVFFEQLTYEIIDNPRVAETFELFLNVVTKKEEYIFQWSYNTLLYKTSTISGLMDKYLYLIAEITNNPEQKIKDLRLPMPHPFPSLSDYRCDFPLNTTPVHDFINQARKTPENIAIVFEGREMSYKHLDEKSTQLAQYLLMNGITANTSVPLCLQSCPEMVIALLAIWKAGAAYIPIDPELPVTRIRYIAEESKSPLILCHQPTSLRLTELSDITFLQLDDSDSEIWSRPITELHGLPTPSSLAYVIYTSGSTGNPKGVCITHRSLTDYFFGLRKRLPILETCANFSFGNTISTDLGNTILYQALTSGGTLHLFTKERFNNASYIGKYFKEHQIDCLKIVPSHWKYLSEAVGGLIPKKLLIFGGEALPNEMIRNIAEATADCIVVNHYGPTETTIGKLLHVIDFKQQYPAVVPIGKPFSNTSVFVFNEHLSNCPIGVPGELYIGGEGVAIGYHNQPELTDKAFIQNPFTDHPHKRLYRTGDMVRWLPDGNIEYLGRGDDQVKIRGNRIEIGEVQNEILSLEGIKNCTVIADHDSNSEKRLVAYVVTGNTSFDKAEAIRLLGKQLPNYMVPKAWVIIGELPLNANGKVDKKLLPKAERITDESGYQFVTPRTKVETLLTQIWQDCLKLEKISIQDDFFELGGHSLIAIKVMLEIEKKTGKRIPITSFFEYPTIERLANLVEQGLDGQFVWKSLVPIKPQGSKPPLYIVHGMGLEVLVFHSLAKHFDIEQPIYGLKAKGLDGVTEPNCTVQQIAEHYIQEILENNPDGPYSIAGYSSGGIIAFEMAHQLKAMGRQVKFLGLIDSFSNEDGHKELISEKKFLAYFFFLCNKAIYNLLFLFKRPKQFLRDRYWYLCWRLGLNKDKSFVEGRYVQTINHIVQIHFDAIYNKYQLQPYDGFTHLFKASERFNYTLHNKSNGWYPYLTGGIELKKIKAGHFNLFESPQIEALAAEIQNSLDVALHETFSEKSNATF